MNKLIYSFISLFAILVGCSVDETQFSREMPKDIEQTNKVREDIGIRKIKPDIWYFYARQISGNHTWDAWKYDEKGMECKHVEYDNEGDILWEADSYYSGEKYIHPSEGEIIVRLYTIYEYKTKTLYIMYNGEDPLIQKLVEGYEHVDPRSPERPPRPEFQEAIKIVDEILKKWGIPRL